MLEENNVLLDHKKVLLSLYQYLIQENHITKKLLKDFENLFNLTRTLRNRFFKFSINNKSQLLDMISCKLDELRTFEFDLLVEFRKILSDR